MSEQLGETFSIQHTDSDGCTSTIAATTGETVRVLRQSGNKMVYITLTIQKVGAER